MQATTSHYSLANITGPVNTRYFYKKFFQVFVGLAILTIALSAIYFFHEKEQDISRIETQENVVVQTGSKLIHDVLNPIIVDVDFLADLSEDIFASFSGKEDEDAFTVELENIMLIFAKSKPMYDQIRFLDRNGKERVRINVPSSGIPVAVEQGKLQNKKNRYYFADIFRLNEGETFISPVDLNIEHGTIEVPFKPMIRFGRTLFNAKKEKIGVVVINYKASYLFDKLHFWSKDLFGDLTLLNRNGYWLHARNKDDEWGFMLPGRSEKNLQLQKPELWNNFINAQDGGQCHHTDGLYTYRTIRPLEGNYISSSGSPTAFGESDSKVMGDEYYWKMVSFVSTEDIEATLVGLERKVFIICVTVLITLGLFSYFLARAQSRKKQYEQALEHTNSHLEETVEKRTEELLDRNKQLTTEIATRQKIESALADSEQRYRSIMDTMNDGVYITSQEFTVTYANSALKNTIGADPTGESCHKSLYGRDSRCPWCIFDRLVEGAPEYYELRSAKDDKIYHISNTIINFQDNKRGKLTIFRDITDYRNTQQELERSELQYATLLQTMKEGLLSVDGNATITYCNVSFCRMLGFRGEDMVGKPVSLFLGDESKVIFDHEFAKRQREIAVPYELIWKRADGRDLVTYISPAILNDQDGKYLGSLGVISDITLEKEAEKERRTHQIIMNLCTNSCQAMLPSGGALNISLHKEYVSEGQSVNLGIQPGTVILVSAFLLIFSLLVP